MFFRVNIAFCCSDSSDESPPPAAVITKEKGAASQKVVDLKESVDPQDPIPSSEGKGVEAPAEGSSKAKAPMSESPSGAVGPFLLTQESEAYREHVSFLLCCLSIFFLSGARSVLPMGVAPESVHN